MLRTKISKGYKKWMIAGLAVLIAGGAFIWYIFTEKFTDTEKVKADYTVKAIDFIKEFQSDMKLANSKYSEKIIVVEGIVSKVEMADTTANIKIIDSTSGAYIIFDFQQQHLAEARQMKEGDLVSIKGSCSNGAFSNILETEYITFKRCAVNK